ncbi:MAG: NAD(P)H-hydrate epimerase, partial [Terriglobales bacterium]
MKIVSAAEMRKIDHVTTERFGVPSLTLMENAGMAVANFVLAQYPQVRRIGVICGKGNNGGDGLVAARKLREAGREMFVLLLADAAELRGDAAEMFKKMALGPVVAKSHNELEAAKSRLREVELLVDAILGTGFRPPVSGLFAEAIAAVNAGGLPVVAVDIPSGADADVMGAQTGAVVR